MMLLRLRHNQGMRISSSVRAGMFGVFSVCDSREMDLNSKYRQHSAFCHLRHCFIGFTSNGKLDFLGFNQRIN